jgi:outer membrane protein OmpA-like peptidoglycan-associated protein
MAQGRATTSDAVERKKTFMKATRSQRLVRAAVFAAALVAVYACKTAPATVLDTGGFNALIQAQSGGLSPNGDGASDTIEFYLLAEPEEPLTSWRVDMTEAQKGIQKTFSGSSKLPASIVWNGTARAIAAPEGLYTAELTLEYAKGSAPVTARSAPFRLDLTAPAVSVKLAPLPFSPDGDGVDDQLTISVAADDPSGIDAWSIDILDPEEHLFTVFAGQGAPGKEIRWDGRSAEGELVQSADDYTLVTKVRDMLGNTATGSETIPVDVLVQRDGERLRIIIASITFPPYSADFTRVSLQDAEQNAHILDRLAVILKKYQGYRITIEGHAVMVYWDDPKKGAQEQAEVLLPLSKARAEAVKKALVERGVRVDRMSTEGVGASRPIVPFSDLENRWKNRRVEFILTKR